MIQAADFMWKQPLSTQGPVPCTRRGHTMTQLLNSSLFVLFGGETAQDELLNDMYTFDASTNRWQLITFASGDCPSPRYRHTTTAISKTSIVVIGGETQETRALQQQNIPNSNDLTNTNPTNINSNDNSNNNNSNNDSNNNSNDSNTHNNTNIHNKINSLNIKKADAWIFDFTSYSWVRIQTSPSDINVPSARSGHSALFIKETTRPPGIYVYGGFSTSNCNTFTSIVYRLRTIDWTWERIQVETKSIISQQNVLVIDAHDFFQKEIKQIKRRDAKHFDTKKFEQKHFPCPRESHTAIWISSLNGMLIFGGETNETFHKDFWLFKPRKSTTSKGWYWKKLSIKMSSNLITNDLPCLSSASGILLPRVNNKSLKLMIWAGMTTMSSLNDLKYAWIIDLLDLKSFRVSVKNIKDNTGRVMHTVVRWKNKLLLCGGVDIDTDMSCNLQVVELPNYYTCGKTKASDFGPLASNIGKYGSMHNTIAAKESSTSDDKNDQQNNIGPVPFEPGTVFTGKVELSDSFGTNVTVLIERRLFRGMLITRPDENGDRELLEKHRDKENGKEKNVTKLNSNHVDDSIVKNGVTPVEKDNAVKNVATDFQTQIKDQTKNVHPKSPEHERNEMDTSYTEIAADQTTPEIGAANDAHATNSVIKGDSRQPIHDQEEPANVSKPVILTTPPVVAAPTPAIAAIKNDNNSVLKAPGSAPAATLIHSKQEQVKSEPVEPVQERPPAFDATQEMGDADDNRGNSNNDINKKSNDANPNEILESEKNAEGKRPFRADENSNGSHLNNLNESSGATARVSVDIQPLPAPRQPPSSVTPLTGGRAGGVENELSPEQLAKRRKLEKLEQIKRDLADADDLEVKPNRRHTSASEVITLD